MISWKFGWVLSSLAWDIEIQILLSQRWANLGVFRFFAKTQEIDGENGWKFRCEVQIYVTTNGEKIISNERRKVSPSGGARFIIHPVLSVYVLEDLLAYKERATFRLCGDFAEVAQRLDRRLELQRRLGAAEYRAEALLRPACSDL